jgi:hypothetical protein
MEQLAAIVGPAAIDAVASNWVTEVLQMHADLVGSAGFRAAFDEREIALGRQNLPCGFRRAGFRAATDGHALAVNRMPRNGAGDYATGGSGTTAHHGEVSFLRGALGELPRERGMRRIILGHQNAPARVFVQTVHDAGPQRMSAIRNIFAVV